MQLLNIPALKDNYIWLLVVAKQQAIIVDPGAAQPVFKALYAQALTPIAILLTHHHADHTDGVRELVAAYPQLTVYGPQETLVKGATQLVKEGTLLTIDELLLHVIAVPGHTVGHVAYYLPQAAAEQPPHLFCGDTLFSAGCGRLFEGSPEQMYHSLQRLAALPETTQICCAHEYTLDNLRFARHVGGENALLAAYQQKVAQLRVENQPSLPTSLQTQKNINPFLRCHHAALQKRLGFTQQPVSPVQVFAELRRWKDHY